MPCDWNYYYEFEAEQDAPYLNIPLKDLKTKKHLLIACLVRNGKAIIPGGADTIQAGDVVLVVTEQHRMNDLGDIMEEAK